MQHCAKVGQSEIHTQEYLQHALQKWIGGYSHISQNIYQAW